MAIREVKHNIFYVGSLDWDKELFDALIPLPDGTSYNSYLIKGSKKTALIDTVEPEKLNDLILHLQQLDLKNIDYIVADHAEQDHSGSIPKLLEIYPSAKVVTNSKCKELLKEFLFISEEKFITVSDKETLSLGDKTLTFIHAPWVHWPDTMFTYLNEDKVLFTTDFLGSHVASSSLFVDNEAKAYEAAKRYYAQIMMPFRNSVKINLEKISQLDVEIIAPSHGQLHNNPKFILDAYKEWSSDNVENTVVLPFVSMHGSTRKMVDCLIEKLMSKNIKVIPFNLVTADTGELAMAVVNAATVVVATPAFLLGAHPKAVYAIHLLNALKPKTKFLSYIASFGWGCNIDSKIASMITDLKAKLIPPVMVKGHPGPQDEENIELLARSIYENHKELGLL